MVTAMVTAMVKMKTLPGFIVWHILDGSKTHWRGALFGVSTSHEEKKADLVILIPQPMNLSACYNLARIAEPFRLK